MRVIAGTRKRMQLKTPSGSMTRPTSDRIKETLFNMLSAELTGCRFLDLFAGSGQMGIEALSRGARYVCFVEKQRDALFCIHDNLKKTGLEDMADVLGADVNAGLKRLVNQEAFQIIFMDPPYTAGLYEPVIGKIMTMGLLAKDGFIVAEADVNMDFSFVSRLGLVIKKEKCYKTNKHVFLAKDERDEKSDLSRKF